MRAFVSRKFYCSVFQQLVSNYVAQCMVFFLDCDDGEVDFVLLVLDFRFGIHFININNFNTC